MKSLALVLLLLCAPLSVAAEPAQVHHRNARFGFSLDVPAGFKPLPPPDNGDGQVFESPDKKATITVYGINNIESATLQQAAERHEVDGEVKISYRAKGSNWFVHSWAEGDKISYLKCYVGKGSLNSLLIGYPRGQAKTYEPLVKKLEASFRAGDLSKGH